MHFSALSLWETIISWDQQLFHTINYSWRNPIFDMVMPFLRNSLHWTPLYVFTLAWILLNYKVKGVWWAVFFLVTVALTDMTGTFLFKHNVERLRPCNDPLMESQLRLLVKHCGSGFSFISNHAANHFGMAVFGMLTLKPIPGRWKWLLLLWAALIAYAQVYVGVHFPLDVFCGALVGTTIGALTASFFTKRFGIAIFDH